MSIIEQIKAEIERQIKDPQEHCYGVSSINKLRELLDFIDTLESEKPINQDELEKEYKDYVENDPVYNKLVNRNAGIGIARHFAQWGAEHLKKNMKDCTTCKYGHEDERLGIPMCHHPKRFSEDCINFNMHEEKETEESEKPINPDDAMKELDEKIALVKQRGTWDGVDVDKYMDEVRGREPVCEELEKELDEFLKDHVFGKLINRNAGLALARHFAEWQSKQDKETIELAEDHAYLAGAVNEREKMMKEAVEGEIQMRYSGCLCAKTIRAINEDKFKLGDKVRVIVLPKED